MSSFPKIQVQTSSSQLKLDEDDVMYFCQSIERLAGISLKSSKRDLTSTRLRSRVLAHGLDSFRSYRSYLEKLSASDPEWQFFTNLLTTNKTDFFREPKHFEYLVDTILPTWLQTRSSTFQVWSAASSTGEEAYTLAMILDRVLPKDRNFRILATDIDTNVVERVRMAVYPIAKKPELLHPYQQTSIDVGQGGASGWFRIKPHIKEKVICRPHNLLDSALPDEQSFDLVLCRNVLIYFSPKTIDFVQKKIHRTVKSQGYFFIGHSESLQGMKHSWQLVEPSIFRKG